MRKSLGSGGFAGRHVTQRFPGTTKVLEKPTETVVQPQQAGTVGTARVSRDIVCRTGRAPLDYMTSCEGRYSKTCRNSGT